MVDADANRREWAKTDYPGCTVLADYRELFHYNDIDLVVNSTFSEMHYPITKDLLTHKLNVLVEKPFARNYTEAKMLTDAFLAAGIPLYVGHYRRALPRFLKIKELLDSGIIGQAQTVDFYLNRIFDPKEAATKWLYNPVLSGGGKFYDIAPHTVDIFQFLFGNIREVAGSAENCGTGCPLENIVTMDVVTAQNVRASLRFCCTASEKSDRMSVTGSNGRMEFSVHGKQDVKVWDSSGHLIFDSTITDPVTVEQPMVQTVVEDLLGLGHCLSHAEDVLITYDVIDQVLDAFYGGRQDDFWNHPERYGE